MKNYTRFNYIFKNTKSLARYKANPWENGTWPKPNNPLDNMQPDRIDKEIIDEYGKYII